MSESLLDDLQLACSKAQLPGDSAGRAYRDIEALIDMKEIIAHHITAGPLPDFSDTFVDVFMLTSKFVYNYVIGPEGASAWGILPVANMGYLTERPAEVEGTPEEWVSLWIFGDSGIALVVQDLIENRPKMRSFLSKALEAIPD